MWTVPAPSSLSPNKKTVKPTPTVRKANDFVQNLEATNLSTSRPGAWLEAPGRSSASSSSLTERRASTPSSGRGAGRPGNNSNPTGSLDRGTESYCKTRDDPNVLTNFRTDKSQKYKDNLIEMLHQIYEMHMVNQPQDVPFIVKLQGVGKFSSTL